MSSRFEDPARWQLRAEELMARLEETSDDGARQILFRIYLDYLRLARLAEERLAAERETAGSQARNPS